MLSAALSNHETQFSFHKKAREELLEKVAGRPPTSGEKEQLQYHADMMEVAESGIASVLAASRIMAFVYPEFARLYANDPATGQLNNAYNRFMAGNRIDLYVHHFRKQLDKTLVLLEAGISAKDIQ
jgi:hypothetical protein